MRYFDVRLFHHGLEMVFKRVTDLTIIPGSHISFKDGQSEILSCMPYIAQESLVQ
jgi:hypothetical protein